ncbi:MAG: cytochrome c maturation protein CcmE [Flavobacteriales bacterium]|nr:cytochrome c maturation protein CcmE [Flavobacteriales bacterium]MCX7768611.1 cytochrome c maturation protein CcmE [Flavobacteriales bacterium]MDW8409736.1 cytochrome c maturation protein CcmE [Flavobacteriales bacterium]
MRKLIILLSVGLGLTGAIIFYSLAEASEYATFEVARAHPGREYHVLGKPRRDLEMRYEPQKNANLFTFYLEDSDNNVYRVVYNGAKPRDFDTPDKIVVVGSMQGDEFHARDIQLKCPSKYNDGTRIQTASQ